MARHGISHISDPYNVLELCSPLCAEELAEAINFQYRLLDMDREPRCHLHILANIESAVAAWRLLCGSAEEGRDQ